MAIDAFEKEQQFIQDIQNLYRAQMEILRETAARRVELGLEALRASYEKNTSASAETVMDLAAITLDIVTKSIRGIEIT